MYKAEASMYKACIPNQIPRERIAAGGLRQRNFDDAEKLLCAQATNTCRIDSVSGHRSLCAGTAREPASRDPLPV